MNRVTLIGRATKQVTELTFVLEVDDTCVPIECAKPPQPGDHVAVEGSLRAGEHSLYVKAQKLDVIRRHMV